MARQATDIAGSTISTSGSVTIAAGSGAASRPATNASQCAGRHQQIEQGARADAQRLVSRSGAQCEADADLACLALHRARKPVPDSSEPEGEGERSSHGEHGFDAAPLERFAEQALGRAELVRLHHVPADSAQCGHDVVRAGSMPD